MLGRQLWTYGKDRPLLKGEDLAAISGLTVHGISNSRSTYPVEPYKTHPLSPYDLGFSNSLGSQIDERPLTHPDCLIPKKYDQLVDPKSPKKFSLRLFDLLTLMLIMFLFLANDNYLHLGYYARGG